ncbi:nucleotide-binding protein [Nitrosomonas sp.]|uniref:nucleotide-binding protein n=1 Tax=Nitrosomonas sp. TaxID=42353 RepID=UPI0025CC1EC7|nr:nucleotide-binding protein [Nitrosomonas sp.]
MESFVQRVELLIEIGWKCDDADAYSSWSRRVTAFLQAAMGEEAASAFVAFDEGNADRSWRRYRDRQLGHLEGLALRVESVGLAETKSQIDPAQRMFASKSNSRKVFLVHGHNNEAKESVARFLERIGLEPIILHEQANEGRTIIEKFEAFADDVPFAVVLMTGDDVGSKVGPEQMLVPRARQNVILELGYFAGKLGRSRVSALYISGLDVPSDLHGVLFTELDEKGAWRTKVAQELVSAGMKIKLEGLLQS